MQQEYFQCKAMDTLIEIEGTGKTEVMEWKQGIEIWFEQFENICSRFRPTSELSILNGKPINTVIQIHPILYEVLKKALDYSYQTDFLFNPFLGTAIKSHGYDKTFSEIKGCNIGQLEQDKFEWNVDEPIIFLPIVNGVIKKVDQEIDLGGIAKGWSVDKVASTMMAIGIENGIVNAGGDLFVWGKKERTIGISHPDPERSDRDIIQFDISNGGIATSNTLYRSWYAGENRIHHILNGKSGVPSYSDVVQTTVFSNNTAEADVLAKILCMHSFNEAVSWLKRHYPHAACIVISNAGQVAISQSLKNYVTRIVM